MKVIHVCHTLWTDWRPWNRLVTRVPEYAALYALCFELTLRVDDGVWEDQGSGSFLILPNHREIKPEIEPRTFREQDQPLFIGLCSPAQRSIPHIVTHKGSNKQLSHQSPTTAALILSIKRQVDSVRPTATDTQVSRDKLYPSHDLSGLWALHCLQRELLSARPPPRQWASGAAAPPVCVF